MDRMRVEKIGAHHHAHVREREIKLLPFLQLDRRRGRVCREHSVHHHVGLGHARHVGKAEDVHVPAISHFDKAIAGAEVHADGIGVIRIGGVRDCVPIGVAWALDERLSTFWTRRGRGSGQEQQEADLGRALVIHDEFPP